VAATGWAVRFVDDLGTTDEPTDTELDTLRTLQAA
jgi:glutaconate CoA-transferase, subunit B